MNKFRKIIMVSAGILSASLCSCGGEPAPKPEEKTYVNGTYFNTMLPFNDSSEDRIQVADPSIVKGDDGYFYIYSTARVVLKSLDCCTWEIHSKSIISRPTWGDNYYSGKTPEVWAPDCIKIKDKWIYYYSLSAWDGPCGIGYAVSDNIAGPYVDMGKLVNQDELGVENLIDPCIFVEDNQVFMAAGSFRGIFLFQLTEDGMGLYKGAKYQNENKILIAGKVGGWDGSTYEGSYIVKKDDYYYFFGSVGSCCEGINSTYSVYVGRSESLTGPYLDSKGNNLANSGGGITYGDLCLWSGTMSDRDFYGPGHNSILIDDKGEYWIVYHAYVKKDNFATRHLMMDKLIWNENGFPQTKNKKPSYEEELDGPAFLEK